MKPINEREVEPISQLRKVMKKLFGWVRYETMSGAGACPVYLERWTLITALGCGIYLHHFIGDDWGLDPHDHPRRFISIGLKGWYWEDVYHHPEIDPASSLLKVTKLICTRRFQAPWIRSFPAHHLHRVRASECGNAWTLVIILPKSREWGFVRDGVWIPFREYVFGGKSRPNC